MKTRNVSHNYLYVYVNSFLNLYIAENKTYLTHTDGSALSSDNEPA